MEYLGLGFVGITFLVGVWYLSRLMSRTMRNDGATHGGGYDGTPPQVP
jgi:hypothetical protein